MTGQNHNCDYGRLIVQGADRPGIVASVSGVLTGQGANIVSLDRYSSDPSGGRFFQRTVFHLPVLSVRADGGLEPPGSQRRRQAVRHPVLPCSRGEGE
jgi:formyltetrahydrofolate deformylase